ncbi:MAG: PfkB family carbohydrate kinase [Spirochaetaceae bacterium]|jgi:ribokinase|nr:PfkB family carbohydrate kinase [Spirochaetaceae bacterium]
MKVLVFGSINIDMIFEVNHIVREGETIAGAGLRRSAGGKGANQAAALAKAGMETWMAGKIGADGAFLRELLESYRVNTAYIRNYEGATGQAIVQLDSKGQNAIVLYAGGNGAINAGEVESTLDAFGAGDIVVLQNEIPVTGLIMEKAYERGIIIALNPSPFDERAKALPLNRAGMLFVNEIEGAALAAAAPDIPYPVLLDMLVRLFPRSEIILTAGKEGAYYGFEGAREKGEIVKVPVADTTGAGDTFLGYFVAARARGFAPAAALAAACKASSIAVSRPGAMEAIPLAAEVF